MCRHLARVPALRGRSMGMASSGASPTSRRPVVAEPGLTWMREGPSIERRPRWSRFYPSSRPNNKFFASGSGVIGISTHTELMTRWIAALAFGLVAVNATEFDDRVMALLARTVNDPEKFADELAARWGVGGISRKPTHQQKANEFS